MNTSKATGLVGISGDPLEADSAISRASASSHAAVDAAAEKVKPVIDNTAAKVHQTIDAAADRVAPAARWATEKTESLLNARDEALDGARSRITNAPFKAVAVAAFVGFLIGKLS